MLNLYALALTLPAFALVFFYGIQVFWLIVVGCSKSPEKLFAQTGKLLEQMLQEEDEAKFEKLRAEYEKLSIELEAAEPKAASATGTKALVGTREGPGGITWSFTGNKFTQSMMGIKSNFSIQNKRQFHFYKVPGR
jgi:hypothetical protein